MVASPTITGNTTVTGTLNVGSLTASQSVQSDGSKNLISVANTGTGNNVLATSPSLTTPNIGAATGSSIALNGNISTSNGILTTSGLANDISAAFNPGNSSTIYDIEAYQTSNTAVKRTLALNRFGGGVTIGSGGLTIDNLTASQSVQTNASKNLITIANTGTGSNVLATSPILADITVSTGTVDGIFLNSSISQGISLSCSSTSSGAVTLNCFAYAVDSTPIKWGYSTSTGDMAGFNFSYFTPNSALNSTSLQMGSALFKMFNSTSTASTLNTPLTVTGLVTANNGVSTTTVTASDTIYANDDLAVTGTLAVFGSMSITGSIIGGVNITTYFMTATFGWPNATDTSPGNWSAGPTVGSLLGNPANGTFQNNFVFNIWVNIIWTASRQASIFGIDDFWIREDVNSFKWGRVTTGPTNYATMTATFRLNAGDSFTLFGNQNSGVGQNFNSDGRLSIQYYRV